jgi:hypothetical protein
MGKLHIANTFFEWELENARSVSLREAFLQHPIFLQLQFLPVVYGGAEDAMLISDEPGQEYWNALNVKPPSRFTLEEYPKDLEIESWGPSQLIASWAKSRGLNYFIPPWEVVKEVNSKRFSFEHTPKLPGAEILFNESQAKQWLESFPGSKVLKTCYGVSGKGHFIIENEGWERISAFLQGEWEKNLPVIAEPWVDRILDFSTQWLIDRNGQVSYVGSTICKNDRRGQYQHNEVGDEKTLFGDKLSYLAEHRQKAEPILHIIASKGFFGNVGIDAMLYGHSNNTHLQPIVEINARKTMGWAAIAFQKRHFPKNKIRFRFVQGEQGFLPKFLVLKPAKKVTFQRNLLIEVNN